MIDFEYFEVPPEVRMHYVYKGRRQMGILMTPASLPVERISHELAKHGMHLEDGEVPLIRRVGEVANQFVQILRNEADADLAEIGG